MFAISCHSTVMSSNPGGAELIQDNVGSKPPLLQPGLPGESTRTIEVSEAVDLSEVEATIADVEFMQGMIGHHAQALEMTSLLHDRTNWQNMRMLAERIDVSQADEIKMMQSWLQARGEEVPNIHAHHGHSAMLMPGMLTPEQMTELAATTESEFDKLFLEYMIMHHQGAVIMVETLFSSPGAGQESQIFHFASDVVADQSMEITRMRRMRGMIENR
tara:strand:+ start:9155 stop:9805 length:651 start_codon:yes stop_codon:yes gene_type:complete